MRLVDAIIFLWFVYILQLEMTFKEVSGDVPLLESDWKISERRDQQVEGISYRGILNS